MGSTSPSGWALVKPWEQSGKESAARKAADAQVAAKYRQLAKMATEMEELTDRIEGLYKAVGSPSHQEDLDWQWYDDRRIARSIFSPSKGNGVTNKFFDEKKWIDYFNAGFDVLELIGKGPKNLIETGSNLGKATGLGMARGDGDIYGQVENGAGLLVSAARVSWGGPLSAAASIIGNIGGWMLEEAFVQGGIIASHDGSKAARCKLEERMLENIRTLRATERAAIQLQHEILLDHIRARLAG